MKELRKMANQLETMRDKGTKHPALKAAIFKKLQTLEDTYWDFLVQLGKDVTAALLTARRREAPWVTYGTENNPRKFTWGALY